MSLKKRVLRLGCISLLLLAFIGYFAFSTFFFSPTEGRFKADVAGLIPRDVDVYVARAELRQTFDRFPTLAVEDELEANSAVAAFLASPEWEKIDRENRISEALADAKQQLSQVPLGLDLFDVAAGEDVALAADFAGRELGQSDWAVYARLSFWGKLAVSALKHPGLLGLGKQGITATNEGGIVTLSSQRLRKPIHIARINDVAVLGVSRRLVERAIELENTGSEDSLLLAAPYNDQILSVDRDDEQRDFELQFDVRKMRETYGMTKPLLSPNDQRFAPAFLARLLPISAVRRVLGVIDFHEGVDVDLSGEFSSEMMTAAQERIYRFKGFDQNEAMDVAGFAPDDTTLLVYVRGPIATILQMVVDSMEPAARQNFTDVLREVDFNSIQELIEELDASLVDRVAFIARPNDWGYESDMERDPDTGEMVYMGPPNDGAPVFAWAVVAWISDPAGDGVAEKRLIDLRERIAGAGSRIGIEGRNPGDIGYFQKPIGGGLFVREFWSKLIPGTGHVASLIYGENLLISNRYAMIDAIVKNRVGRGASVPRLSNRTDFQVLLQDSAPSANVLVWADPRSGTDLLRQQGQAGAANRIRRSIDYVSERPRVEADILQRAFGGRPRNQLTADDVQRLDELVNQQLQQFTEEVIEQNMPRELASLERTVTYLNAITSALALIQLSPKDFELSVRVVTPYEQ